MEELVKEHGVNSFKIDMEAVGDGEGSLLFDNEKAQEQIAELKSEITSSGMRSLVYMFNKNMRRAI